MEFKIKAFEELNIHELYAILALRNEVFILEQNCPYQDIDGKDIDNLHVMGYENGELVGYCRILKPGVTYKEASIGRVIVKREYRKGQYGSQLMRQAMSYMIANLNILNIRISAQAHLVKFYSQFGFETCGEIYLEDDIEHIEMYFEGGK